MTRLMIGVRFEHRHDKHPTITLGPFLWAQCTDMMRVSKDETDNGDVEIAYLGEIDGPGIGDKEEGWVYEGNIYTDVIIFAWKGD